MQTAIERVKKALSSLQEGKMIILTDHPDRENEGDLIFPAENVDASCVNFMIRYCSGIICLSMTSRQLNQLGLNHMVPPHENSSQRETPFMVSIEAREGVTTGVSAHDRAKTILAAIKDNATAKDIVKPGHIFPLKANDHGVLGRPGHTEGALDLVRLAGFKPAAVLCELMNEDGTMMRGDDLHAFANAHDLIILSIEDIITYRLCHDNLIEEEVSASLPIDADCLFEMTAVKEKLTGEAHLVLEKKNKTNQPLLVRIHSSCMTGDIFGSLRCDCHQQLHYSLKRISEEGGMLIYLNQEGRGIGLFNKIKTYSLQEKGLDTVEANEHLGMPADSRNYHIAANILRNRKITAIRLLTNNPSKLRELHQYGIPTVSQETMPVFCNEHNKNYLQTKKNKLHHMIDSQLLDGLPKAMEG